MTYFQAVSLFENLNIVKNNGLSVDSLLQVIKLRAKLKTTVEAYHEVIKGIMEGYSVQLSPENKYEFSKHPQLKEIKAALTDLDKKEVDDTLPTKFMTMKELHAATADMPTSLIGEVAEWLIKD